MTCAGFERDFLASWACDSPNHLSYYRRITEGPDYLPDAAARLGALAMA